MGSVSLPRLAGTVGVGLVFAVMLTPLSNVLTRALAEPARLAPADAIVVLGSMVWPDGSLGSSSLRRAVQGIRLHRLGLAPLLVFLGESPAEGPTEPSVRASLAHELGVVPEAILPVLGARTTREEAVRIAATLGPGGRRILLVTDALHLGRARRAFERVGFEVLAAPVDEIPSEADTPGERLWLARQIVKELLARLYYRLAGYG
jgi:uncharacterized SAM-binding protein YcdF (DUF218 family)